MNCVRFARQRRGKHTPIPQWNYLDGLLLRRILSVGSVVPSLRMRYSSRVLAGEGGSFSLGDQKFNQDVAIKVLHPRLLKPVLLAVVIRGDGEESNRPTLTIPDQSRTAARHSFCGDSISPTTSLPRRDPSLTEEAASVSRGGPHAACKQGSFGCIEGLSD
jgi:hypothetical protein